MNRDQWNQWFDDFSARLPETAAYLAKQSQATRDAWFEGIFEAHDLEDALQMNRRLWETGEGISRFERDKLPSLFIRTLQEVAYDRQQREQTHKRRPDYLGAMQAVQGDAVMGPAFRNVVSKIREYKQTNSGDMPSNALISQWTREYLDEHDTSVDDDGPRYKCHRCRDTGWQNYDSQGRVFCGACSHCDAGAKRAEQKWRSGRTLGLAPAEADDNAFNRALLDV